MSRIDKIKFALLSGVFRVGTFVANIGMDLVSWSLHARHDILDRHYRFGSR